MNRIVRSLSPLLSFSLILAAPGLAPYQAAAQTIGASRIVVPVGQLGAAGAAINSLGGASAILPAASLQAGLIPSLSPSAVLTPVLSVPAAAVNAVPAGVAATSLTPVAPTAAIKPAAVTPEKLAATPVSALNALQTGSNALISASKNTTADAPRVALDGLFEGSAARSAALAVDVLSAPSASADALSAAAKSAPSIGDPRPDRIGSDAPKPTTSVKRTLSIGLISAVLSIAMTMATITIAQVLGHQLHPNYQAPTGTETTSLLQAFAIWIGAAVMAPISEEAIFRGGMQGTLAKLSAKLRLGAFVVPALITSVLFVALHETSDPVLFSTRLVHAMVISYVYHKEGILAAMASHAFFNGLLALSIVLAAAQMPILGFAVVPLAVFFAFRAWRTLKAQKSAVDSGTLAPQRLTAGLAVLFAGLLMFGYFFIMPNIFWPLGAVALVIAAIRLNNKKA